jgi:hypothetical protein
MKAGGSARIVRADRQRDRELEEVMSGNLKKIAFAAVAALAIGAGVAVSTAGPADAQDMWRHHGGYYGHGGGWHGGGWHGGGWGPAVGLGILGGAIAGAAIANSAPYYGPGPYYGNDCVQPRPMYDAWGRYIGDRMVNVCY